MQTATQSVMPAPPCPGVQESAQIQQMRAEYVEMPGLNLTAPQAARLWAVSVGHAQRLLARMVETRFLEQDATGTYRRRGCRHCW